MSEVWTPDDAISSLAKSFEKIAEALTLLARIEAQKFEKQYPEIQRREAKIDRPGDDVKELYSDKGTAEWFEETEAREPSRFRERFEAKGKKPAFRSGDDEKGSGPRTPRRTARTPRKDS